MPLYPLPVILAIIIWGLVFLSTGKQMMLGGLTVIALGLIAFVIKQKRLSQWPFEQKD
jgi:hypothetical protein